MDGAKLIATQDAYFPAGDYCSEAKLSSPEDLYYRDGVLYIADSGNGRIVTYTLATGALSFLGEDILVNPTGLAVAPDGRVFVADYGASEIVVLSADGAELLRIPRPQEIYYGNSPYKPRKIDYRQLRKYLCRKRRHARRHFAVQQCGGSSTAFSARTKLRR